MLLCVVSTVIEPRELYIMEIIYTIQDTYIKLATGMFQNFNSCITTMQHG